MEPWVLVCEGCRVRIRAADPSKARGRDCPRCATPLASAVDRALGLEPAPTPPQPPALKSPGRLATGTAAVLVTLGSLASLALREPRIGAAIEPSSGPVTLPIRPALIEPVEARPDRGSQAEPLADGQTIRKPGEAKPLHPTAEVPTAAAAGQPDELPSTPDVVGPTLAPPAPGSVEPQVDPPGPDGPRRVLVRDRVGQAVVAREYGQYKGRMAVLLPDGQIGWVDGRVATERPFAPATLDELHATLRADPEFATFQIRKTAHYLVLYQGTSQFAKSSADLLERLYEGLTGALRKQGLPVSPPEFPLVAVIFASEDEFRASRRVAPDVQAYYEILSNRIYFYETSRRDQDAPEVSALRKPQTVAHEGTHQVLHNVGVQPRLSDWPPWLVEGFAEYCSPPRANKKGGVEWAGLGQVNPIHMATIRDLDDPASTQVKGPRSVAIGRDRRQSLVEYLVTREDLTPTDYALSWALVHYLARERLPDFVAYMKRMSNLRPFEDQTPEQRLAAFRESFGDDLGRIEGKVARYLTRLKVSDPLPYYAVIFEQPVGPGLRRMAMVSQSPSVIRQWLESASDPEGGPGHWQAFPHRSRANALQAAEQYLMGGP